MSGGSSSKQESSNRTVTTTNTSTVQGIEDGAMVAGGNITTIDGGTVDLARLAVETSMAGLIDGQGEVFDFGRDVLTFANETIGESLESYGETAFKVSRASSSDTTEALNNALKYGGIGIAVLAAGFVITGAIKR
jgi:hypothetical protein